jgi:hypothetical protein
LLPESAVIALVGLSVLLVLAALSELDSIIRNTLTLNDPRFIPNGVNGVYPHIRECLLARRGRGRKLEVLGLTLYTAWPQLGPFFADPGVRNWDVDLYLLDPEWLLAGGAPAPPAWAEHARAQVTAIKHFVQVNGDDLKKRHVKIILYKYCSFPAVHGFRVDSQHVFVSLTRWSSGVLADPLFAYEHVTISDVSKRSQEYTGLFDNWLQAARLNSEIVVRT